MIINLPWPHKSLSPNARIHFQTLAKLKKSYRAACGWECKSQGIKKINADFLNLEITFYPPDKRHRDLDNMLSSIKSGLDGVADILGVDDSAWSLTIRRGVPKIAGEVSIIVTVVDNDLLAA